MRKIDRSQLEIKQSNVLDQWVNQHPEVVRWLGKQQRKAFCALNLYFYCYWSEKTPAELLALKDNPASKEAENLLDTFVASDVGLPESTKFAATISVRSFYKWNYRDLSRGAGVMSFQKKKPYWKPNKDDLRKVYRFCTNPRDRSIITQTFSSAIAKETLSNLKWKHLEDEWEKQDVPHIGLPPQLIKGHGVGRYKGVEQHTFITPEAKRDLIEYKAWIEQKIGRKLTSEDSVYWTTEEPYKPLDYKGLEGVIERLQKSSGVNFSLHDARRYVETALEEIRISPNWARKIRGRKVKGEEAPYSRPAIEQLREKYREAVPLLEFTSEKPTVTKEMIKEEVSKMLEDEKLKPIADKYHITIEQVKVMMRTKGKAWLDKALKETGETATNGGCAMHNCQRVVSESELENLLAEGYRVAAVLPSGKVVVEATA